MPDFLLVNIGNTRIGWAQARLQKTTQRFELACGGSLETAAYLRNEADFPDLDHAEVWAACVVPAVKNKISMTPDAHLWHWVDAASAEKTGLNFSRMDVSTLGADRIANAVALLKNYPLPAVNFDCGTALTMEVVLSDGTFAGGAIAPGRILMRKALTAGTAALPEIPLCPEVPERPGCTTKDAIRFGVDRGVIGTLREWMASVQEVTVQSFVVSGGDADFFAAAIPELQHVGSSLTLQGILAIALAHRKA